MDTKEIINELLRDKNCIFRGEKEHYDNVSSKLYREYHDIINDNLSVLDIQKGLIKSAKRHILGASTNIDVLTELQHYGGKTALIDFTNNALIALFFACYGKFSEDGRIIVLKKPELLQDDTKEQEEGPYSIQPSGKSPRVIFQSSIFVQVATGYLEEGSYEAGRYKIINIENEHKPDVLEYLNQFCGIDADTIYNDIHGFIQNKDNYITADTEFYRGNSCHKNKKYSQAIKHYDNAIKLNSYYVEAFYNCGIAYTSKGEYDLAIANYTNAIALRPDFAEALGNRGKVYAQKGEYDQAIADLNEANKLFTQQGKIDLANEIKPFL